MFFWIFLIVLLFIIYTDGAHFGKRVVRAFYTFYAPIYTSAKPLTWVRNRTIRRILREHVLPLSGTHLDVATGTGRMIQILASESGWKGTHTGVDYTPRMLKLAEKKTRLNNTSIQYILGDANELDLQKQFTIVTCLEALELFEDPEDALRRIIRHATPDGYVFITKMREFLVSTIPKKALSRKMLEGIFADEGATVILYTSAFNTRYELCLVKKNTLPTSTCATTT